MKLNILKARVKRNNLEKYAGRHYRDETSQIVKSLNEEGKKALLGIQKKDGIYTILGEEVVYYLTASGNKGELPISTFLDILHAEGLRKGNIAIYRFVKIGDEKVWICSKFTMSALMNTMLWLETQLDKE
ncbi:MAG: hypothetical protein ACFB0B_21320 [Thermonemataceae bacterium]